MSSTLKLVSTGPSPPRPFEVPPFSLQTQPQRPGDLCESVVVDFPTPVLAAARRYADEAAIPLPLWLTIAVEAERALQAAVAATGVDTVVLANTADRVASQRARYDIPPPQARRLASYAGALRVGDSAVAAAGAANATRVVLRVSHLTAATWSLAAARTGRSLEAWVTSVALVPGRELWEATAAASGLLLSEWLLLQAARLARSTSAVPHAAA
jgi:hypothetical protein